jgi:hypothetical protein
MDIGTEACFCHVLATQVINGVELVLREVSVTAEMGPQELVHFMGSILVAMDR